jgi:hypothetical protein
MNTRLLKSISGFSAVAIACAVLCGSCSKPTPAAIVAAAGLGSFNATVNGTATSFLPAGSHNSGVYTITGSISTAPLQSIAISTLGKTTGTYTLNSGIGTNGSNAIYATGPTTSNLTKFRTDTLDTGTLTITAMDTVKKVMSGTFSFTAKQFSPTASAATVTVTNGNFTNLKW